MCALADAVCCPPRLSACSSATRHIGYAAILPCGRRGPEEDLLGEESGPPVAALRLISVHAGHRQPHQEVRALAERSGYDFTSSQRALLLIPTLTKVYGIKIGL